MVKLVADASARNKIAAAKNEKRSNFCTQYLIGIEFFAVKKNNPLPIPLLRALIRDPK